MLMILCGIVKRACFSLLSVAFRRAQSWRARRSGPEVWIHDTAVRGWFFPAKLAAEGFDLQVVVAVNHGQSAYFLRYSFRAWVWFEIRRWHPCSGPVESRVLVRSMRSMLSVLVLVLVCLLVALVLRALAGPAVAIALSLTLLLGGGVVMAVNRRS